MLGGEVGVDGGVYGTEVLFLCDAGGSSDLEGWWYRMLS